MNPTNTTTPKLLAAALAAAALATGGCASTGEKSASAPMDQDSSSQMEMGGMDMGEMGDMQQMLAMMEQASAPDTRAHEMLAKMAGNWTITARFSMAPGAPPEVSTGTSRNTLVLDGRQLMGRVSLDMEIMGQKMPFSGIGFTGYNKDTQQFESIWMDTMSTGQMRQTGTMEGDTIVVEGDTKNMMGEYTVKNIITFVDGGYDMEFWEKGDMTGGELMNTGVIEYRKN